MVVLKKLRSIFNTDKEKQFDRKKFMDGWISRASFSTQIKKMLYHSSTYILKYNHSTVGGLFFLLGRISNCVRHSSFVKR